MLEKVIHIKNIGRFKNCSPIGDVSLRKLTLVYADNGRGKTTLCSILRSLKTGNPKLIAERRMLGAKDPASVHFKLSGKNATFTKDIWSEQYPDIEIFDSTFIHDNVYTGDYVDHEHKKSLYRIILGSTGVLLATKVDTIADAIKEKNRKITALKEPLASCIPDGVTLEKFLSWQPVPDIDMKIQEHRAAVATAQFATLKLVEIGTKPLLEKVTLPTLPTDFLETLGKGLENVAENAEERIKDQIAKHGMKDQGEIWLAQGLQYTNGDDCPFCGQGIGGVELIKAYRSHFNEVYGELKSQVTRLAEDVEASIGEAALVAVHTTLSNNATAAEFWKNLVAFDLPELKYEDIRGLYSKLRDGVTPLVERKQQQPTQSVTASLDFELALKSVDDLNVVLAAYNQVVAEANKLIQARKLASVTDATLEAAQTALKMAEAQKKRFEPAISKNCKDYADAVEAKSTLESEKQSAKDSLDTYCVTVIADYQTAINDCLAKFNAGFRIVNTKHDYIGGSPRSSFQIEINNMPVGVGDAKTPEGTHCFKTTLSAGDRSALALAFFLASLKHDRDIKTKIVVLDDPFNSLDRFRRTCTQQLIVQIAQTALQVVVLSHDPFFLRLILDAYNPTSEIKTLQLRRTGDSTIVGEWDIVEETQSTYLKDYSTLHKFYCERIGSPMEVARAIRPFLEGLLRSHFPGHFLPNEWLGDFLGRIRDAPVGHGLEHLKPDLSELESINDYSKRYHHQQNPAADSEIVSPDELHGFVKRTLKLAGGT